ncbi:MAG TPA: fibronectin type III domain-containing protein [Chloroflexota bacterium]|nr:fibronectin type III domain-containing protein [Chloroflexota bacterium]
MKIRKNVIPWLCALAVGMMVLTAVISQRLSAEPLACNSTGFVITGADANWCESTTAVPTPLSSLLNQVLPRIAADYTRAILRLPLTAVPTPLNNNLALVADRVGLDYARASQRVQLAFPVNVVNDTAVPQLVGDITSTVTGPSASQIRWTTNEFADSLVHYGTDPGNYTMSASNDLYVTNHAITLTGLQADVTYFFKVSSTDLSGNTFQSSENSFTFTPQQSIYLPVIVR